MLEILKPLIPLSLDAFSRVSQSEVATKGDGSVVTICDFALQALIINGLHQAFPDDKVLGEEDLAAVPPALLSQAKTLLPNGFDVSACPGTVRDLRDHRVWVIDPIDGTQGFVTRGHFAIATALLVDRQLKCSITATMNVTARKIGVATQNRLVSMSRITYSTPHRSRFNIATKLALVNIFPTNPQPVSHILFES